MINPNTLLKIAKRIGREAYVKDGVVFLGTDSWRSGINSVFDGLSDTDMRKMMVEWGLEVIPSEDGGSDWFALDGDGICGIGKTPNQAVLNCVINIVENE